VSLPTRKNAGNDFPPKNPAGSCPIAACARRIPELIVTLAQRVESLLAAGWREVRIVTDHGWLLVPKCLPKTDLPKYLTATRWGRCAVVKPAASVELTCFSWFWAEDVRIACPPGIDSFIAGKEYSHGGLSLQECLVRQLTIQGGNQPVVSAKIESFKWAGLRCRVKVEGSYEKCKVDLRDKAADPATSLVEEVKSVGKDGMASLVVKPDLDSRGYADASRPARPDPRMYLESPGAQERHAETEGTSFLRRIPGPAGCIIVVNPTGDVVYFGTPQGYPQKPRG
jgi:hypothetical protein